MFWLCFEISTYQRWLSRKTTSIYTVIQSDTGFKTCFFFLKNQLWKAILHLFLCSIKTQSAKYINNYVENLNISRMYVRKQNAAGDLSFKD
jgi:hypothetical protein